MMRRGREGAPVALLLAVAAALSVACGSAGPTPSVIPSAGPSTLASSPPTASGSAATADCPIPGQNGRLPSNVLVNVSVESGAAADRVTFKFGQPVASPAGDPTGTLTEAHPPFSGASSGLPIDVAGSRFLELRFEHMLLADEAGNAAFTGSRDQEVEFPAVRQVTEFDESEGVVGWYIGFDGPGCVRLTFDGASNAVQVEIAHG